MKNALKAINDKVRNVWEQPKLHSRLMSWGFLGFSYYEIDSIRALNSESRLHNMMADQLLFFAFWVIAFYISTKTGELIVQIMAARFGIRPDQNKEEKDGPALPVAKE